ncbi:MAG TPA: WecB/TagA/CpsF family glycosyltransferase [Trueperaceae bacterium]
MRHYVLGLPLDALALDEAAAWVLDALRRGRAEGEPGRLVVTLNPEIVVRSRRDEALAQAIRRADLVVADGVGVAWAARRQGIALPGRVPGVDLVQRVLELGGGEVTVFLLGARPGVAEAAGREVARRYGTRVAGAHHGYFGGPEETAAVVRAVRESGAGLLLAGLGERQETFLHRHAAELGAAVMMGVGGTLDVLAGHARRMPRWTSRLGLEWLFRVALDPRRWRRAPRLWRFALLVLRRRG